VLGPLFFGGQYQGEGEIGERRRQTFGGDFPLAFQIALVAAYNDGKVILILDPQNLLLERQNLLEALTARNAVDE